MILSKEIQILRCGAYIAIILACAAFIMHLSTFNEICDNIRAIREATNNLSIERYIPPDELLDDIPGVNA